MREPSLREEKWSPQMARDKHRLGASLPTQRFDVGGRAAVSGIII